VIQIGVFSANGGYYIPRNDYVRSYAHGDLYTNGSYGLRNTIHLYQKILNIGGVMSTLDMKISGPQVKKALVIIAGPLFTIFRFPMPKVLQKSQSKF